MESNIKEHQEILVSIKEDMPNFVEEELLEYAQLIIPRVHFLISHNDIETAKKYCSEDVIYNMLDNKDKYRISKNMDNIRVGFVRLEDYEKNNNKSLIKLYTSIFFYDDVDNNEDNCKLYDKYWNDIWSIKFEGKQGREIMNKCPTCGSLMEYNTIKHMFSCVYCRNSIYYSQINWKIVDIEVNGISYT